MVPHIRTDTICFCQGDSGTAHGRISGDGLVERAHELFRRRLVELAINVDRVGWCVVGEHLAFLHFVWMSLVGEEPVSLL